MKTFILSMIIASATAIELTPSTWEEQTAGKAVFIKFFAPWCGHCKRMKPAWDNLMKEYENSDNVLVADVDCIGDGKPLCDKVGVKGFPTIKHGDPNDLQDYQGGRDQSDLETFAKTLKPGCVVATLENCSEKEKKTIDALKEKSHKELKEAVVAEANDREEVHTTFKEEVEKLHERYADISKEKDEQLKEIKSKYNIGFVKQLIALHNTKSEL